MPNAFVVDLCRALVSSANFAERGGLTRRNFKAGVLIEDTTSRGDSASSGSRWSTPDR
jgi:hypothetical protein